MMQIPSTSVDYVVVENGGGDQIDNQTAFIPGRSIEDQTGEELEVKELH